MSIYSTLRLINAPILCFASPYSSRLFLSRFSKYGIIKIGVEIVIVFYTRKIYFTDYIRLRNRTQKDVDQIITAQPTPESPVT